jgi:hypothetical protein
MSEQDPRREAAAIARGLKRHLERTQTMGAGDLVARDALASAAALAERLAAAAPAAGDVTAASVATPAPEAPAAKRSSAPPAAPAPRRASEPVYELPSQHAPLNPAGFESRAALYAASLPELTEIAGQVNPCTKCQGNLGGLEAAPFPAHDQYHSLHLTVPPLGCVMFEHQPVVATGVPS